MKPTFLIIALAVVCGGCVTAPLEHYTVNQSLSTTQLRYQEVMNTLAMVAANPGILPSYSLNSGGAANVSATISLEATTEWTRAARNFGEQILNVFGKHTPELQWGLDPVTEPYLLAGAWYACRWAISGPPADTAEYQKEFDLLRKPVPMDIVGCHPEDPAGTRQKYHLDVLDKNNSIPFGWLSVGPHRCVPHGACYTAHCGKTYVWVMPEGLPGLADFTLVLLDIATTDPSWLALQKMQATASVDLTLPGSADFTAAGSTGGGGSKSMITETWHACQMEQPDGSTSIVVRPFAEPFAQGTGNAAAFSTAHMIQKSTLDLYGRNYVNAHPEASKLPLQTGTPAPPPPPGAPAPVNTWR